MGRGLARLLMQNLCLFQNGSALEFVSEWSKVALQSSGLHSN